MRACVNGVRIAYINRHYLHLKLIAAGCKRRVCVCSFFFSNKRAVRCMLLSGGLDVSVRIR